MNLSPFCEMKSETSSSQPCAGLAVQITSVPSTSHSADSACEALDLKPALLAGVLGQLEQLRWRRIRLVEVVDDRPERAGRVLADAPGDVPGAFAWVAFSASAAPPPSSSSLRTRRSRT